MVLLLDITDRTVSNAKFSADRNPTAYICIVRDRLHVNTSPMLKATFPTYYKMYYNDNNFLLFIYNQHFLTSRWK
jgi:hypothetical protein